MDVISVLKVIDQIKKTQSCTASVLCRIGCILEYLLGLLKKNDESDQKVIKDLSDLKEIVDKAVSDLSGLTARVSTLEYRMDIEIPAKFHEQLLLIQNNSKEIDTNRINIADNLNSINLLWDALAATDTSIGNWGDIVAGINNRIDNIMSLTTNLQTQINNLSTRITELSNSVDTRISNINTTLQDHSGRIENLEDEDRNIHNALDDIRADIAELTGGSGTLSQDISELQNRVSVLESSLANLDNYVVTSVLLEGARFTVNLRNLSTGTVQTSVLDLPIASEQYPGLITVEGFTKLEGIEEGAQVNVQSDWNESAADSDAFIKNKPNLAPVATSGSYNDLTDKPSAPEIPDQVNADWNATSGVAQILNKPNLATVATSGQYNDLEGKPAIPPAVTLPGVNVVDSFPDSVSGVQDGTVYIVPGSGGGGGVVTPSKPYMACGYIGLSSGGDVYQTNIHLNNDYLSEASVVANSKSSIRIEFTLASGVSKDDIYDSFICTLVSSPSDIPAIISPMYVWSSPKAILNIVGTSDDPSYYMLVSFFIPLLV